MTSRIRMGHPHGQTPPNVYADFDWIRRHEKELVEQYGECSIIVYQQRVLGTGATYAAALEDAERNLPPDMGEVTPVHQWLRRRHPILRVRPSLSQKTDK
jgi:tetrahydromethanopterin S-methyltransferase subunit H